jgi:hypothetical protein
MFKWIVSDFFLKRQGLLLPVGTQQAHSKQTSTYKLKDRLGDQRGGSEWEPIKVLLEGD